MIIIKCINKIKNKHNVITHYQIQDTQGNIKIVTAQQLKTAIMNEQVECVNLQLTSDNKLIDNKLSIKPSKDKKKQNSKNSDIDRLLIKIQALNSSVRIIDKDIIEFTYKDAIYRVVNKAIYLKQVLMKNGTFEIPSFVSGLWGTEKTTRYVSPFNWCERLKVINHTNITSMKQFFSGCSHLVELDLSDFDTSKVTDMSMMFNDCERLLSLDLSNFNTSKVTTMEAMFCGCFEIREINISSFDTSNVNSMARMFGYTEKLERLDVSNFDTSKVTTMERMFAYTEKLERLDVSNFDTSKVTTMEEMFYYCAANEINGLSRFNISKVTNVDCIFANCSAKTLDISTWDFSKLKVSNVFFDDTETDYIPDAIKYPKIKERELREERFKSLLSFYSDIEDTEYEKKIRGKIAASIRETHISFIKYFDAMAARVKSDGTIEMWIYDTLYVIDADNNIKIAECNKNPFSDD